MNTHGVPFKKNITVKQQRSAAATNQHSTHGKATFVTDILFVFFLDCCLWIESFQRPQTLHNWEEPICYIIQNGQDISVLLMLTGTLCSLLLNLLVTAASVLLQDSGGSAVTSASSLKSQRCATCTEALSPKGELR